MNRLITALFLGTLAISTMAQKQEAIGEIIDDLTYTWDLEADDLRDYDGFSKFCVDKEYGQEILKLLKDIHHYDSVLYSRLSQSARFGSPSKEVKKTLKDIEKFETEYDMNSFIAFLNEECIGIQEIEKNRRDLEDEIAQESYDGQRYILENELNTYIKHITKNT